MDVPTTRLTSANCVLGFLPASFQLDFIVASFDLVKGEPHRHTPLHSGEGVDGTVSQVLPDTPELL